jgi:hypothetical protein
VSACCSSTFNAAVADGIPPGCASTALFTYVIAAASNGLIARRRVTRAACWLVNKGGKLHEQRAHACARVLQVYVRRTACDPSVKVRAIEDFDVSATLAQPVVEKKHVSS